MNKFDQSINTFTFKWFSSFDYSQRLKLEGYIETLLRFSVEHCNHQSFLSCFVSKLILCCWHQSNLKLLSNIFFHFTLMTIKALSQFEFRLSVVADTSIVVCWYCKLSHSVCPFSLIGWAHENLFKPFERHNSKRTRKCCAVIFEEKNFL